MRPAEQLQFACPGTEPLDDAVNLVRFVGGGPYLSHQHVGVQTAVQERRITLHTHQTVLLQTEMGTVITYSWCIWALEMVTDDGDGNSYCIGTAGIFGRPINSIVGGNDPNEQDMKTL